MAITPQYEIVNGKSLPQFQNRKVWLFGTVVNTNQNGLSFDVRTVDDCTVRILLKKPQTISADCVMVEGTAQGESVQCDHIVEFLPEMKLDVETHNTICALMHVMPGLWDLE